MPDWRQLRFAGALALWALLALTMALVGVWLGFGGHGFAVALAVLLFLLAGQIFLATENIHERLARILGPADVLVLPLALIVVYLFYALGTGAFSWARTGLAIAYVILPAAFVLLARQKRPGAWADYVAVGLVWFPVEIHWLRLHWLYSIWPYPRAATHTLTILFALNVGLVAFLFLRKLEDIGYTLAWGRGFTFAVAFHFLVFAAIAIPLGDAIGFIHFGPSAAKLKELPLTAFGILFFTAWPEEFLFRGLLQNLLAKTLHGPYAGLIVASVIFGFTHINNGSFPNWRYVLLAAIAGLFYGRTWMKTGSITASCLVHALVDITWRTLFRQ